MMNQTNLPVAPMNLPRRNTTGSLVAQLNEHDILLGRGTGPNKNRGNVNFRETMKAMLRESGATTDGKSYKSRIVHKILKNIKAKKGRFLRKLTTAEATAVTLAPGGRPWSRNPVYAVAPDQVAIAKTRQALRFQLQKNIAHQLCSSGVITSETEQHDAQQCQSTTDLQIIPQLSSADRLMTTIGTECREENAEQSLTHTVGRNRFPDPIFGASRMNIVVPEQGLPSSSAGFNALYNSMQTTLRPIATRLQVVDPTSNYWPVQRPEFDLVDAYKRIASRRLLEEKLFQLHSRPRPLIRLTAPDQHEEDIRLLLSRNRVQGHCWMH